MNTTNNTAVIQEKLSERAVLNLSWNESLLRTFEDYSRLLATDWNTVKIPKMNAWATIQIKAEDWSYILQDVDTTPVTVNVTKRAWDAFAITDELSKAEKVSTLELRSEQIVDKLKDYLNTDWLSVITSNVASTIWDWSTDITAEMVANAAEALDDAWAPKSDRYLVVSNRQFYKMKLLPEFVTKEFNSWNDTSNIMLWDILWFTVIPQSNLIIWQNNVAYHKSTLWFASNKSVWIESDRNLLKKQDEFTVDMVYWLESVNPEFSVRIHTL